MSGSTSDSASAVAAGGVFPLGTFTVHRIGYGAMQLAGDGVFGPARDRDEAVRVLRAAIDGGVDHIDTAQFYGSANELIREALQPYPSRLAIVSKVGARRNGLGPIHLFNEPDQLRQSIEENLATLGVSRIAAVNLRLPDPGAPPDRFFEAQLASLVKARDEGLIGAVGLSNISRRHLLRALEHTEIATVQNLFNLADQRSRDVLQECAVRGISFVPYCPLGLGRAGRQEILASPFAVSLAQRLGATPAQVALAWLLDLAPNILLIPGTRTRTHLAENLRAANVEFDDEARRELARHFRRGGSR
jgi:pyridoxine 4-dehydrogenase